MCMAILVTGESCWCGFAAQHDGLSRQDGLTEVGDRSRQLLGCGGKHRKGDGLPSPKLFRVTSCVCVLSSQNSTPYLSGLGICTLSLTPYFSTSPRFALPYFVFLWFLLTVALRRRLHCFSPTSRISKPTICGDYSHLPTQASGERGSPSHNKNRIHLPPTILHESFAEPQLSPTTHPCGCRTNSPFHLRNDFPITLTSLLNRLPRVRLSGLRGYHLYTKHNRLLLYRVTWAERERKQLVWKYDAFFRFIVHCAIPTHEPSEVVERDSRRAFVGIAPLDTRLYSYSIAQRAIANPACTR